MRHLNSVVDFTNRKDGRIVLLLLVLVFSFVVLKNAWVGDDAYITFRTVENFLSGHGLTFNPLERVQTYTHPLWMFLISGVYFITNRLLGIAFWAQLYYTVCGNFSHGICGCGACPGLWGGALDVIRRAGDYHPDLIESLY